MTSANIPATTREIHLAARPVGVPRLDDLELTEAKLPELADGQILVRNTWMSVDPYMRGRMDDVPSPVLPPFAIGEALDGSAIGEVVASRSAAIAVGATVSHFLGWREHAVLDESAAEVVDTAIAPAQAYLGPLGPTGLTAYAAVTDVAPVRPGDVVFVSSAAGAVGSVAGQIARKAGAARVIGSAGGPEKAAALVDVFGFDAAIDHRAGPVGEQLARVAPDGIDVYVDNVGGEHLAAALDALHVGGRVALVGAISGYNAVQPPPGPSNLVQAVLKQITLRGMQVGAYLPQMGRYTARAARWLADGSLRTRETVFDGLEQAPEAMLGVLTGAGVGKVLVRLGG
jgi:NADPH-dependent curcumin reductase CurA